MQDHLDRRTVLSSISAVAAAAATVGTAEANTNEVKVDPNHMTAKQKALHAVRFPKLDQESLMNFSEGIRRWQLREKETPDAVARRDAYLAAKGFTTGETDLSHEKAWDVLMQYPLYAAWTRLEWSNHDLMYDRAYRVFHGNREKYLADMEAADKAGPGTLELHPDMTIPEYTTHEIHRMPGGYVGDPFAGFAYHWSITQAYYAGSSKHDEIHIRMAQGHRLPANDEVNRVLEIGCASGMTTTAYKERFPEADVWGIDVAGPMVRYAHYRAAKMGIPVNFAQRLAEDTKFPDNHFDLVTDFLLFHEVTTAAARKIVAEMYRVMRPGGVWMHNDLPTENSATAGLGHTIAGKAHVWNVHRHNYEPWYYKYVQADFADLLRETGFTVELDPTAGGFIPVMYATKPVKA